MYACVLAAVPHRVPGTQLFSTKSACTAAPLAESAKESCQSFGKREEFEVCELGELLEYTQKSLCPN